MCHVHAPRNEVRPPENASNNRLSRDDWEVVGWAAGLYLVMLVHVIKAYAAGEPPLKEAVAPSAVATAGVDYK